MASTASLALDTFSLAQTRPRPCLSTMLIFAADCFALGLSLWAGTRVANGAAAAQNLRADVLAVAVVPLFGCMFWMAGLYPGLIFSAVAELRRLLETTTIVYVSILVLSTVFHRGGPRLHLMLLVAWGISLVAIPLARTAVRRVFVRKSWWGCPVLVFARGKASRSLIEKVLAHPESGMKLSVLVDEAAEGCWDFAGIPVVSSWAQAPELARQFGISHAIISPGVASDDLARCVEEHANSFTHLYIIPDLPGFASLRTDTRDVCRTLAIEVRNNLLLPVPRIAKRLFDLAVAVAAGLPALPLICLIAILIKLESRGPAFYGHRRIGRNGASIKVWKFRTMVVNSDAVLREYLACNPGSQMEWQRDRKLRDDPRVTRVGRFLRKTSLDELPQLLNILLGDMSAVGPRPIVTDEVREYGTKFSLYTSVRPGLTGLWQVSGRNDTSYAERVALDAYYVGNWSPWLDVYVLACTVPAVLHCRGAY